MNQQINFYLPEFRKEKDRLDFAGMVTICVAFIFLLGLMTAYQVFNTWQSGSEIAALEIELEQSRARSNALADSFGVQNEDQQIVAEVNQLEENLQGKRALLTFLEGRDIGNTAGFSEFLADLSRFHINGLRLTGITLRDGGKNILLNGEVNRAENVPLYLQNLRRGNSYNGKTFETLRIAGSGSTDVLDTRMLFEVATTGSALSQ